MIEVESILVQLKPLNLQIKDKKKDFDWYILLILLS